MKVIVSDSYEELSKKAADLFISILQEKPQSKLGLATGSSPIGLYKNLIKAQKQGEISFHWAKTINLDEYVGIDPKDDQSYQTFMNENLFDHVNIKKENTHLPKADTNDEKFAEEYNKLLDDFGTRDLQVLGLGPNGHIAFNEPGDFLNKRTSIVKLADATIEANSRFFASKEDVPKYAISMGMADAFNAKTLIVIASGKNKKEVVKKLIEGKEISPDFPASFLSLHPNCYLFVDKEAMGE